MVQTDQTALEWLNRLKDNNTRLTRWSLSLQPFEFTVNHQAGMANSNADTLSGAHHPPDNTCNKVIVYFKAREVGGNVVDWLL